MKKIFAVVDTKGSYLVWSPSLFLAEEYVNDCTTKQGWSIVPSTKKKLRKFLAKNTNIPYELEELELINGETYVIPKFQLRDYHELCRIESYRIHAALSVLDFLLDTDDLSTKDEQAIHRTIELIKKQTKQSGSVSSQLLQELHDNRDQFGSIIKEDN